MMSAHRQIPTSPHSRELRKAPLNDTRWGSLRGDEAG
jgi:hypothetical protein